MAETIDTDADVQSGGETLLDSIENIGLGALQEATDTVREAASDAIRQGRMPYDPADSDFGAVRPQQQPKKGISLVGLLVIFLIVRAVFK